MCSHRGRAAPTRPLRLPATLRNPKPVHQRYGLGVLSGVESDTTSVVASTAASEPLVLLCEGEDDGMQHFRAFLQFRVLPAETGKFVIGVGTRPHAGLLAGG